MKYKLKKANLQRIDKNFYDTMQTLVALKDMEKKGIVEYDKKTDTWHLTEKGLNMKEV